MKLAVAIAAVAFAVFGLGCARQRADRIGYVDGGRVTTDNSATTEMGASGDGKMTAHEVTVEGHRELADTPGQTTLTAGEQPVPAQDAGK